MATVFKWIPNKEQLLRHHAKVGETLYDDRLNERTVGMDVVAKLCDGTMMLIDAEVAIAHSNYFRHALVNCCRMPFTIDVTCFDVELVREVFHFLYCGTIELSFRQLPQLLAIARILQLLVSGRILQLDLNAFRALISCDDLPVGNEMDVFHVVTHYFFNSKKRSNPNCLFELIRYDHLNDDDKLEV
ncbi:unnamed protein product [Anisakis simplex]|uniref:BTB domain-containing protein n=1 Tax=Anisakis simplex TaxID=6269 RepID=A0A0M3K3N2_ANISI|nr:unnamed protein product [Anisakis simplex]